MMLKMLQKLFGLKEENEYSFPNLLEDKDFVEYYWTLPIMA